MDIAVCESTLDLLTSARKGKTARMHHNPAWAE